MLGLAVLFFIGLYLTISLVVVLFAAHLAKKHGRRGWVWGSIAVFVMYNLVFWDWVPTLVMHKYYCSTQAGLWVYKTPEQWLKENPGVTGTLGGSLEPDRGNTKLPRTTGETTKRSWLTQRFYNDITRTQVLPSLGRTETNFFDAKTGELIARSVNYFKGASGNVLGVGGSLDDLRQALLFGMFGNRQCGEEGKSPTDAFDQFIYQFWKWGENK